MHKGKEENGFKKEKVKQVPMYIIFNGKKIYDKMIALFLNYVYKIVKEFAFFFIVYYKIFS